MKYLMTGLEDQLDKGFGINADAFKKAGDQLYSSENFNNQFIPQKHMPIFYLYRHSIELYLKSMIFLIHLELKIPYGEGSNKPQIYTSEGKWRDLDNCHWVDALYWYWTQLIIDQSEKLQTHAPKGDWRIQPDLKKLVDMITNYDKDSTYFRYPFTKNNKKHNDAEKYSMRKIDNLQEIYKKASLNKGGFTLILKDDDENINAIYSHEENVLSDLLDVFKETSDILYSFHIMTRMTLCEGF
jgi:hypothetical protein